MSVKRILVTGGAGFIGAHTVSALLATGKEVWVLDNLFSGDLARLNLPEAGLRFIEGDVLDYSLICELLKDCDAVLHLAAIASVPKTLENPIYALQVNTQGLLHLLEAIRHTDHPVRCVYASSAAVYGEDVSLPCSDQLPLIGVVNSPYGLQKRQSEEYAELYARIYGVPSLGLRYFNVYGQGQDPHSAYAGVVSRFIERYKQDKVLEIFGDGQQARDFIAVKDVARANRLALESAYTGVLNIATGFPQTLLDLVKCIEQVGVKTATCEFKPPRLGDIKVSYAQTTLAAEMLAFKSDISFEEGIAALYLKAD